MHHRVRQHGGECLRGFRIGFLVHQLAGDFRNLLLHQGAQILHQRRLQRRVVAGLQHAGNRSGHTAQRHDVRTQAADRDRPGVRRFGTKGAHQFGEQHEGGQKPLRPAAFKRKFAGDLVPAVAFLAQQGGVGKERVLEDYLIEMVFAGQGDDRAYGDPRRVVQIHQELADTAMAFLGRAGAAEQDHVVRFVGEAGPDLGAVDEVAALDLRRLGADGCEVGPDIGLAHANAEEGFAGGDPG